MTQQHTNSFSIMRERFNLNLWPGYILRVILRRAPSETSTYRQMVRSIGVAAIGVITVTLIVTPVHLLLQVLLPHATVNISLLYLPAIIWLAAAYGARASIMASVLAILAYDFFFITPLYRFTIDDPSEWLSLGVLLLISLVVGFFTAELRQRERYAQDSQERTETLYTLSQEIAATTSIDMLIPNITKRFCENFASEGITSCSLWLPHEKDTFAPCATSYIDSAASSPVPLDTPAYQARAELSFKDGHIGSLLDTNQATYFIPLRSGSHIEGILSVSGTPKIESLFHQVAHADEFHSSPGKHGDTLPAEQFGAFCDQVALALDRARLQQEAIHVAALRESEHVKDALLSSITHDLRTPITAIQTAASSLQQVDIILEDADREMLTEKIMSSARRLAGMVDNLLTLTRLEGGAATVSRVSYPLNDVIATALDELETAGQIQHHIEVDIAEDPLEALMDHSAIERVMINLIENAIKYSPPESTITISARRLPDQNRVEVCVSDEGIGIPSEELHAIFTKFHRLQQQLPWSPAVYPKGTGLGLAACAGIIREHGGVIWAENLPSGGSVFCFTLPTTIQSQGNLDD
jgi:two-component system, OmpR family, sensor histidine kinase KdpD